MPDINWIVRWEELCYSEDSELSVLDIQFIVMKMATDKQVKLDILDIDKYKRMVGMIWIDNRNINLEMVSEGYAEAFVEYLKEPYRSKFVDAEQEAKAAKKGIWSLPEYERPRDFRRRLKVRWLQKDNYGRKTW